MHILIWGPERSFCNLHSNVIDLFGWQRWQDTRCSLVLQPYLSGLDVIISFLFFSWRPSKCVCVWKKLPTNWTVDESFCSPVSTANILYNKWKPENWLPALSPSGRCANERGRMKKKKRTPQCYIITTVQQDSTKRSRFQNNRDSPSADFCVKITGASL